MSNTYPILRHALRPEYAEASDDVIEMVVAELYGPEVSAEDAEEFLGGIGRAFGDFGKGVANVAKQAAPVLGNALPGMLSGAATGAALGPWGALAGAAVGGVSSALSSSSKPRAGARRTRGGGALGSVMGAAGPVLQALGGAGGGAGAAGALGRIAGMAAPAVQSFARGDSRGGVAQLLGAAGQAAAGGMRGGGIGGQIAGLLARPEVQQALTSQLLGPFGRSQVSVGGAPVPSAAVMNMLGSLFNRAATESLADGQDEAMPAYLMTGEGEYAVDPANPDARAAWLAQLIAQTPRPASMSLHGSRMLARGEAYDDAAAELDPYEYDEYASGEYDEADDERVAVGYSLGDLDEYDEQDEYDEYDEYAAEASWPQYAPAAARAAM